MSNFANTNNEGKKARNIARKMYDSVTFFSPRSHDDNIRIIKKKAKVSHFWDVVLSKYYSLMYE